MHLVDTANSDGKSKLGLLRNIVVASLLGVTLQLDGGTLLLAVFVDVLLGALENLDLLDLGSLKK